MDEAQASFEQAVGFTEAQPIAAQTPEGASRFRRALRSAKLAVESAVVAVEVLPVNEAIRYGAFAAAQYYTENPIIAGSVLGLSNLAIEAAAAYATPDIMNTQAGTSVTEWANKKLRRVMPEDKHMGPVVEAGVAYLGGTSVVLLAKQVEDPSRTVEQNRKHGLFTAGWLSALLTVQGVLVSNGISNPEPTTIGAAAVGTGGIIALANYAKNKFSRRKDEQKVA